MSGQGGAHSLSTGTKSQTAFVDSMNRLASTIGLTNTRFYNETGLDNYQANPGHVYTFSNNRLFGNGVNAQGKPSLIAQQF